VLERAGFTRIVDAAGGMGALAGAAR